MEISTNSTGTSTTTVNFSVTGGAPPDLRWQDPPEGRSPEDGSAGVPRVSPYFPFIWGVEEEVDLEEVEVPALEDLVAV